MTTIHKSRSQLLHARAIRVMVDGNTRHTLYSDPLAPYAESGKGCRLSDADGKERIDFINNYSSLIHGHCHQEIVEAASVQLNKITAVGLPTEHDVLLAELLCDRIPSIDRIRFVNSGTEAVMMAIKTARAYTGRAKIAKTEGAFHGSYDQVEISLAPPPENWGPGHRPNSVPVCSGTPSGITDDVVVLPLNDIDATKNIIREHANDLSCVIIDPAVSRIGYIGLNDEYLQMLREVTQAHGILLLFDEVYSLRTGYSGYQGRRGITPDITAIGKIIGGGFPVGAFGASEEIMSVYEISKGFPKIPHGGTFNANPMTMAAGLKAMQLLTEDEHKRLDLLGDRLRNGLKEVFDECAIEAQVYGFSSLISFRLTRNAASNYREFVQDGHDSGLAKELFLSLMDRGILCNPSHTYNLSTAMSETEIDTLLDAMKDSLLSIRA